MKVYVAARMEDHDQAKSLQKTLRGIGLEPTSRWVDMEQKDIVQGSIEFLSIMEMDLADVKACDLLVLLKPKSSHRATTGGHHVETGFALALGKGVILIGERENIFHWHQKVRVCSTVEDAVKFLHGVSEASKFWR